jgi:hypothetical protein
MAFLGIVDRSQKLREIRGLIDGPQPGERIPKPLHVALGQQPYGNNAFVRHGPVSLIYVRNAYLAQ